MTDLILTRLASLEREEDIRIIHACESGSRAWGFASEDSDYDARFIYVRRPEWYLSVDLEEKRDVVELPIEGDLDINGWDLRKALRLLRRSNPPLLEWLTSPIIYRQRPEIVESIRALLPDAYSPLACACHYLHMAQGNYRSYLRGAVVSTKKYLYVLRPLLAIGWIERDLGPVPVEFATLVDTLVEPGSVLRARIDQLLERKRNGGELGTGPRVEDLNEYIERELERLEAGIQARPALKVENETLNLVFRGALRQAWEA